MEVRVRFAPSPTGFLHIGGVRTALYCYLVARKNNGFFALRIEDTDRKRFVPEAVDDIVETLKWLRLNFDEGPIYQSHNLKTYQRYAKDLIEKGKAFEKDGAIWFKTTKDGQTSIVDLVGNRKIDFDNSNQDDFVILKSDGYPTYHLAHVVDDHLWKTSPVIRGAEWISSIPKHVQLFKALGWEIPQYAHLPIILGTDRSKLSKRHGAKAASEFRKEGYLAEAILNYMALLGWTPKKEILTLEKMIEQFDLKEVNLANPIFDSAKLEWMNGEHIRRMSDEQLSTRLEKFLEEMVGKKMAEEDKEKIAKLTPLIKERIKKLIDFIPLTDFIFNPPEYDKQQFEKLKIKDLKLVLAEILKVMEKMEKPWQAEVFEATFRKLAQEQNIPVTDMFQLIRVAVSGQLVTPPLFESIKILGEEEALDRIKYVIKHYPNFPLDSYTR